ncbi:hypothetical protein ACFV4N_43800 [Actinosynnema sp. NPDC059797]
MGEDGVGDATGGSARSRDLPNAAVAGLIAVAVLAAGGSAAPEPGDAAPTTPANMATCIFTGSDLSAGEHCGRLVADLDRRAPLTEQQRAGAREAVAEVEWAVLSVGSCAVPGSEACGRSAATPYAVQLVDDVAREGYRATARFARPDDPAPTGSVLYAVEIDRHVCLVGYVRLIPRDQAGSSVAGRLPDGRCLSG